MSKKNNYNIGKIFIIGFVILFVFIFLYWIITETFKTYVPIDCSGNWNDWDICDTYLGTKTRTFNMIKAPLNGGICPGPEIIKCSIDCSWNWNDWTVCNANTGIQTRTIKKMINSVKNGGIDCPLQETRTCDVDCSWNWNNWSICDINTGTTYRTFNIKINPHKNGLDCPQSETISCQIDCSWNWNNWSDWSDCATKGQRTRTSNIIHPLKFGGAICPELETKECSLISNILGADISGDITTDNSGDKFIIFKTGNCSFIVKSGGVMCDVLMIGGGGAGGAFGGGGGAGACILSFQHKFLEGLYNVNVGSGGTLSSMGDGTNGGDSSIYKGNNILYLAKGGGSGGKDKNNGNDGGCGGGAGIGYNSERLEGKTVDTNIVNGSLYFSVLGNDGGYQTDNTKDESTYQCAGGGGIAQAGSSNIPGWGFTPQGGIGFKEVSMHFNRGFNTVFNLKSYFANGNPFGRNDDGYIGGGGGGSSYYQYPNQGLGGKGGGGNGYTGIGKSPWTFINATPGTVNTGGGGGGGAFMGNGNTSMGHGGSGIVIIRYRERGDWN
jgi:hypothetical protein